MQQAHFSKFEWAFGANGAEVSKLKALVYGRLALWVVLIAGLIAGTMEAIVVTTPQETIKIKLIDDAFKREVPRFNGFFHGVSTIIWANHNMRAAITAMRETTNRIFRDKSLEGVEREVVSVSDVFDLMGNAELADAERRYLPKKSDSSSAVILAASRGSEFGEMTEDKPKCMLEVRGQPLLRRLVDIFRAGGVRDVTVVRGHRKEAVNLPDIKTVQWHCNLAQKVVGADDVVIEHLAAKRFLVPTRQNQLQCLVPFGVKRLFDNLGLG